MAFLGALSLIGSAGETMRKQQALTQAQQFRQEMLQLREMQMQNALQRQSLAMGAAAKKKADAEKMGGAESGIFGLTPGSGVGGTPDTTPGPQSEDDTGAPDDYGYVPVADDPQAMAPLAAVPGGQPGAPPPGMPPAGAQPGAGAPQGQPTPGQQAGGLPPGAPPMPGAGQPVPGLPPGSGPGFPGGQLAQIPPQGRQQMQPGMQPPGANGAPSFAQPPQQPQQPQPGKLYAQASPQEQRQVAQGDQPPAQQRRQQPQGFHLPKSPEELGEKIQSYRDPKTGKPLDPEVAAALYKKWLPQVMHQQTYEGVQAGRVAAEESRKLTRADRLRKEEMDRAPTLEGKSLDEAAEHYYKTGDYGASLGYSKHRDANVKAIKERAIELHPDDPVKDWPDRQQAFKTRVAGLRVLQQRGANLRLASNESKRLIPRVESFIDKVSPTQFPDLNKIIQAGKEKVGDENVVQFGIAVESLKYVYARILKPVGVLTVTDINNAQDILQKQWSAGQLRGALTQMKRELKSAEEGLRDTEAEYGLKYGAPDEDTQKAAQEPEQPQQQPQQRQFQPGQLVPFKDGTRRPWKGPPGGDINDPKNYGDPTT